MSKYMKINYEKLISILEDLGYPYSDTLINIFYNFSNNLPTSFKFYYMHNNNMHQSTMQSVLSFSRSNVDNVFDVNEELEDIEEDNFFPFAVDDCGNYIGLYMTELGEELIYICLHKDWMLCPVTNEDGATLLLDDFANKL